MEKSNVYSLINNNLRFEYYIHWNIAEKYVEVFSNKPIYFECYEYLIFYRFLQYFALSYFDKRDIV